MATRDPPAPPTLPLAVNCGAQRCVIGIASPRGGDQLVAALVGAAGFGASASPKMLARAAGELPPSARGLLKAAAGPPKPSESQLARFSIDLAECAAALVEGLFCKQFGPDDVFAVGLDDSVSAPALPAGRTAVCSLCDTGRLAELSGLNVVDCFASRDLASGGSGEPLYPLPYWLWFADRRSGGGRTRLFVELDRQTTLVYLPPHRTAPLTPAITIESSLTETPTATADYVASVVERRDPDSVQISELVLAGPRRSDPALLRAIANRLPVTLMPLPEFGVDEASLDAACAALLALLHIDQVAANIPELTGARAARVLGRLTPGNPARWRRLLLGMAERNRNMLPLRNAV